MAWRATPPLGPSQMPESAPECEGFMFSSSGGMVVVSRRQGTVPFSFSSNIWHTVRDGPSGSVNRLKLGLPVKFSLVLVCTLVMRTHSNLAKYIVYKWLHFT